MKFNTKIRYGLRSMIELALNWNSNGVFQKEISKRQEISFKYLDHIIASLKAQGLIVNAMGRKSGYKLAKQPDKITIYDIYKTFEPELLIIECLANKEICDRDRFCAARDFWSNLNKHIEEYLKSVTLEDLAQKQKELNQSESINMFYI